jgi:hypothetical protein
LAKLSSLQANDLAAISHAAAAQAPADQDKRVELDKRLSLSDQNHH